jgi:hypothetical protein
MARNRTQKSIAGRHDLQYFAKPHPLRRGRLIAVVAACAITLGWLAFQSRDGKSGAILNPGPLTPAHAFFQNDCLKCHVGNGHGGFFNTISDNACLQCHSANIHHPNSATLISTDGSRSANCLQCHVEHHGRQTLLGGGDQVCLRCHANLENHFFKIPPASVSLVWRRVGGFTADSHPAFGRELIPAGSTLPADPTVLRFNHAVHMKEVKPLIGQSTNCTVCHATPAGPDRAMPMPISFARDCVSCHKLELPAGTPMPHGDAGAVRLAIAGLSPQDLQKNFPPPAAAGDEGDVLGGDDTTPKLSVNDDRIQSWQKQKLPPFASDQLVRLQKALSALPKPADPGKVSADPRLVQFYVAFMAGNSCLKCHDMTGDATAGFDPPSPTTQPAEPLQTVPTGIPPGSRHWFVHSFFDHDKHRELSCLDCHAAALTSTSTADLLLPNLDGPFADPDHPIKLEHETISCVHCHHPDTPEQRGAGDSCLTCHAYHDRTLEPPH